MAITINVNLDEILAALKDDLSFAGNADKYIKVNATEDGFELAAVAGGGTWGSITGNLPDQTDLQNALNLKADLSGADFTGQVTIEHTGSDQAFSVKQSGAGNAFVIIKSNGNTGMIFPSTGTAIVIGENATQAIALTGITVYTNAAGLVIGSSTNDAIYISKGYMQRTGAANKFDFYGSSAIVATIQTNKWNVAASVSGGARFRWIDGVAPSAPVDGDMWRVGDVLYLRDGSTTKSITFT